MDKIEFVSEVFKIQDDELVKIGEKIGHFEFGEQRIHKCIDSQFNNVTLVTEFFDNGDGTGRWVKIN